MYNWYDDEGNLQVVEEPSADYVYTYAGYLQWHREESVELRKGFIITMAAPGTRHQVIGGNLYETIRSFLHFQPGKVFFVPSDVRFPVHNRKKYDETATVIQPGLYVVCGESNIDEYSCLGATNIAMEILSLDNDRKEMQHQFALYAEAGILEYWSVAPVEEIVINYCLENESYNKSRFFLLVKLSQPLFIPGLQINTTDIFKQ